MADNKLSPKELEIQEKLLKVTLEDITTVTLNTDALKNNFEIIIEILKNLSWKVNNSTSVIQNNTENIKDLKEQVERLEKKEENDRQDLNNQINDTNSNLQNTKEKTDQNTHDIEKILAELKELKDNQSKMQDTNNDLRKKVEKHEKQIDELFGKFGKDKIKSQSSISSVSDAPQTGSEDIRNDFENFKNDILSRMDLLASGIELDDLKKKLDDGLAELRALFDDYVKKTDFEAYQNQTDNKLNSHDGSIEDLYKLIEELKNKLGAKLDCDNFDEHLVDYNNLKNIVLSLSSKEGGEVNIPTQIIQQGPSLSTKDANLLKELGAKFPELENLIKKLQKDLNDHLFVFKSFSDDASKKFTTQEDNLKNLKTDTNRKLKELEEMIKGIKEQLNNLNISSMNVGKNTSSSGGDHSVEIRKLQITVNEHETKIEDLLKLVTGLQGDCNDIKQLRIKVQNIHETTMDNRGRISTLEEELNELKALKARVDILEQLIKEREKSKPNTRKQSVDITQMGGVGGGVSLEQVRQVVDEAINDLRNEILALIEELRALLEKKADADDLWKSEAALLEKLDQVAGALMKRSQSDKNDTKKALIFLEKKIKEITVYLFGDPSQGEDGAIFAKKPWTPWSCASCDNKLNNYPGPLIDHKSWNKLPGRATSPERMSQGKFGKGWSKWADNKKTTIEKMRESHTAHGNRSTFESLPEIHKDPSHVQFDPLRKSD